MCWGFCGGVNAIGLLARELFPALDDLIAAEMTGRKAFLMELDPLYCDVIVQRWEQFTGKKADCIHAAAEPEKK